MGRTKIAKPRKGSKGGSNPAPSIQNPDSTLYMCVVVRAHARATRLLHAHAHTNLSAGVGVGC